MKYTKEFKEEALKLSDEIGVRKTAEQLGLKVTVNFPPHCQTAPPMIK